jgi:hypothetical protein
MVAVSRPYPAAAALAEGLLIGLLDPGRRDSGWKAAFIASLFCGIAIGDKLS